MRRASTWQLAAVIGLTLALGTPAPALALGTKIDWKAVEVPAGGDHDRLLRTLRQTLTDAAKGADFGKAKAVVLSARVVDFSSSTRGGVHRVSCTIVGRIVGGPTAKSRISFGGRPSEREALEKQVLAMVSRGVLSRLAAIVRTRAAVAR